MFRVLIAAGALCLYAQIGIATEFKIESGETQVGLLELYTSEGCSSCPPADQWLSGLKNNANLWTRFVPVGLHVDYWDYIGWKDRFASPNFSRRQRNYAQQNHVSTVYTPGFVYNGREWRNWFGRPSSRFPQGGKPGNLALSIADGTVQLRFMPSGVDHKTLDASVALLGFGIATDVGAGENAGRELSHDFLVLGVARESLRNNANEIAGTLTLPTSEVHADRYAIAAWVSEKTDPTPLQAVGGWLPTGL